MSRCAHDQSDYRLRKLPRCSRCKKEFTLVAGQYPNGNSVEEWECPKCHKFVARDGLREEEPSEWEQFLHERCRRLHAEEDRRKQSDCS